MYKLYNNSSYTLIYTYVSVLQLLHSFLCTVYLPRIVWSRHKLVCQSLYIKKTEHSLQLIYSYMYYSESACAWLSLLQVLCVGD